MFGDFAIRVMFVIIQLPKFVCKIISTRQTQGIVLKLLIALESQNRVLFGLGMERIKDVVDSM
jgi:hypothetical protein